MKKRGGKTLWDPPFEEKQKEEKRKSGRDDSYDGDLEERPDTVEVGLGGSARDGDRAGTLELSLLRVLPKLGGGKKLRDVRMIALSSTLCEWLLRVVVTALQEECQAPVEMGRRPYEIVILWIDADAIHEFGHFCL